jgi:hypothetical protein
MTPPKEALDLVEHFDCNKDQYICGNYNGAQLRQEFVKPFLMALGWDTEEQVSVRTYEGMSRFQEPSKFLSVDYRYH